MCLVLILIFVSNVFLLLLNVPGVSVVNYTFVEETKKVVI